MSNNSKIAALAFVPAIVFGLTLLWMAGRYAWFGIATEYDRVLITFMATFGTALAGMPLAVLIEDLLE